jgi:hypothetical protein
MQVYTNGSRNTRYSHEHANLALGERLQWMGVKASEWVELGVGYDQLLELSDKDVEKVSLTPSSTFPHWLLDARRESNEGLQCFRQWRCSNDVISPKTAGKAFHRTCVLRTTIPLTSDASYNTCYISIEKQRSKSYRLSEEKRRWKVSSIPYRTERTGRRSRVCWRM